MNWDKNISVILLISIYVDLDYIKKYKLYLTFEKDSARLETSGH